MIRLSNSRDAHPLVVGAGCVEDASSGLLRLFATGTISLIGLVSRLVNKHGGGLSWHGSMYLLAFSAYSWHVGALIV